MQREDVERLATELDRQDEYAPLGHMGWEAAAALRALLAERDAAFAAGQEDMRERAAEWCSGTAMTIPYGRHEPTHDVYAADEPAEWGSHQGMGYAIGIRALAIKPRP